MRLKMNFTLLEINGEYMAVPISGLNEFKGLVRLNTSGAEVFRCLQDGMNEDQIAEKLMSKHSDIDLATARKAVKAVTDCLLAQGLLED